VKMVTASGWN